MVIIHILCYLFFVVVTTRPKNTSNPVFIGRRWLFKQLEDLFQKNDSINGVLLVGDPGSGKTTIMKQLVNSRNNSSRFIHENIIAFYSCEYDRKITRDGETFVKSLVEQLSQNVLGYKKLIQDEDIQNKLHYCKNDLLKCAEVTVFDPLHKLNISLETKKFILIDALDECHEKKGSYNEIIEVLHGQEPRPSSWVTLFLSSRKETTIIGKMSEIGVKTVAIDATSKENLNDIRSFAQEMISRYDFRKENGESMKEKLTESIETILEKTDGNFLFIKKLLEHWEKKPDIINLASIPSDMTYVYARSFRERFEKNELQRFAKLFEILLALKRPPTLQFLKRILTVNGQMDDYKFDHVVGKLHTYLRFDNGIVRIYHKSFAEWLTNHDTSINGFSIKKSRGHRYIADDLFNHYNKAENELTVEGLYELSMHVLNGETPMLKEHVSKLKGLNSNVTDRFGECVLHYLARNRESTKVLEVFIQQFKSVDVFSKTGLTPTYYATRAGNYYNLELLIKKGADVNYVVTVSDLCSVYSLFNRYINYEYYSLTFIAADKGYREIVELLMNNGAHFEKEDKCGWKPLYVAAKAGHFKIVELLINKTDRTSSDSFVVLFQAAFFNHSDVLKFLLETGLRDKCIPCKRDYKDNSMFNLTTHQYLERICGSLLNIAVFRRYQKIVEILLSYGKKTLECKSLAGLTPLMRAVERNDTKMVTLLLDEGADLEAQCENSNHREYLWKIFSSTYYCSCTSKAIHISLIKGTSKLTTELINRNADRFSRDCMGWSADDLAAIYNEHVNTSLLNNKTVIRYSAVCGSVKVFELLSRNKYSGVLTTIYEDGMTLLHLASLGLTNVMFPSECSVINCTAFECPRMSSRHEYDHEKQYLKTIKLLTKAAPQNINKKDKHGRTALHYATLVRSPDVVKHLIRKGSDWKIKDENGDTALKFVLKLPIDYINLGPCSTVIYSLLNSSEMAISNEMHGNCLRMLRRVRSLNVRCNLGSTIVRIVKLMDHHNLPLSWYALLKIDADLYCLSHENPRHASQYRVISTISELLKVIIEFDVKVSCEIPGSYSTLHVMAMMLNPIFVRKNYVLLLQRYVTNYSMESRILDECYDADGFLPIHYAVLWSNIDAVDLLINHGVDIWKKTRSGLTTFHLSLLNGQCSPRILDKLLNNITSNKEYNVPSGSDFWCNTTSKPAFALLHIAARSGLRCLRYIHENSFIPISRLLFTSCTNTHGIDLLYLLKLYHVVEWTTEWNDLGLPTNTTLSKYPERDAEYHLIYNYFFLTPHVNLNLKFEVNVLDLFRHPGINNLLPHVRVIEEQIKRCYNRCWRSASHASRNYFSTFRAVSIINDMFDPRSDGFIDIVPQMAELRYHCVKMFYNVSTTLWRQVSKAYTCSRKCRCLEIMRLLQKEFTSYQIQNSATIFIAERLMAWNTTFTTFSYVNVLDRWPFGFLLKKALKMDKEYNYLKILSPLNLVWKPL
jgi:ankyrin repeat protein